MASKVMKRGTVDQVDETREAKERMVILCNVVKLVLAVPLEPPDLNKEVKSCIQNDQFLLACGKKVPLLSNACVEPLTGV